MRNMLFPEEEITLNDLHFICYMIERVARKLHQRNVYVVNKIGKDELKRLISLASVLHCENPLQVEHDWIVDYGLVAGDFDITAVNPELCEKIPTPIQMGAVYKRLIRDTLEGDEDYIDCLIKVYNDPLCEIIDDYNSSAYYEPSYFIARALIQGGF